MPTLALKSLLAHPDNANRMPAQFMVKLAQHIRQSGEYPPLIVRPHPTTADHFQILDGHHRAQVLRQLGYEHARCEIWDVDDERATLLLLTLNRLHGEDDPQRRGALFERLRHSTSIEALAELVPEDSTRIQKLIDLTESAPFPAPPPPLRQMPHAITFFLSSEQRDRLVERLDEISNDRSKALIELLDLNAT